MVSVKKYFQMRRTQIKVIKHLTRMLKNHCFIATLLKTFGKSGKTVKTVKTVKTEKAEKPAKAEKTETAEKAEKAEKPGKTVGG